MSHSTRLRSSDYQTLLRILGELGELPPDPLLRRRHALTSLAAAFDAPFALFCQVGHPGPDYRMWDQVLVGFDALPQDVLRPYFEGHLPLDPAGVLMSRTTPCAPVVTHLRRDLVPDADWYASEHYTAVRAPLGIDDAVYTRITSPAGNLFGINVIRPRGARPLTDRHRELLHLFNTHAHNLYHLDEPLDASPLARLAPRLRPVALRFLEGDSVKQAARHLGLSTHTVVEYSKLIHRTFNVSSRSELLLVLMRRSAALPALSEASGPPDPTLRPRA
jgi:DNA-binding CsgD family transcriptional regulator